jgi:hypothetical protein
MLLAYVAPVSSLDIAKLVADGENHYIPFVDEKSGLTIFKVDSTRGIVYHYVRADYYDMNEMIIKYPEAPILRLAKLKGLAQGMSAASDMCKIDYWKKDVLEKGIEMRYIYYDKNNTYMTEYSFNNFDCPSVDEKFKIIDEKIDLIEKKYDVGIFKNKKYNWNN